MNLALELYTGNVSKYIFVYDVELEIYDKEIYKHIGHKVLSKF